MDPEEMKQQWNDLNKRIEALEDANSRQIDRMRLSKLKTAQDRLVSTYQRFSIIAPLMVLLSLMWIENRFIGPTIACYFMVFFAIAGLMDLYLWKSLKRLDFNTMGVETIAEQARFYRKRHHIFQVILIIIAIPLLTMLIIHNINDKYMLAGCLCGLIIGVLVGLNAYYRIMNNYRELISSYR